MRALGRFEDVDHGSQYLSMTELIASSKRTSPGGLGVLVRTNQLRLVFEDTGNERCGGAVEDFVRDKEQVRSNTRSGCFHGNLEADLRIRQRGPTSAGAVTNPLTWPVCEKALA